MKTISTLAIVGAAIICYLFISCIFVQVIKNTESNIKNLYSQIDGF